MMTSSPVTLYKRIYLFASCYLIILPIHLIFLCQNCCAQIVDSSEFKHTPQLPVTKKKPGFFYKPLGNSNVLACSFTSAQTTQFSLEAGRAFISTSALVTTQRNIGFGYDHLFYHTPGNYYHLFYEISAVIPSIAGVSVRLETLATNNFSGWLLRPYVGVTIAPIDEFQLDIQYSYSFLIRGNNNPFNNGLTLRAKILFNKNKWEDVHSSHHHH